MDSRQQKDKEVTYTAFVVMLELVLFGRPRLVGSFPTAAALLKLPLAPLFEADAHTREGKGVTSCTPGNFTTL